MDNLEVKTDADLAKLIDEINALLDVRGVTFENGFNIFFSISKHFPENPPERGILNIGAVVGRGELLAIGISSLLIQKGNRDLSILLSQRMMEEVSGINKMKTEDY